MKAYITLITLISTHHSTSALSNNPRNYGIERRTLSGRIDDDYDYLSRQDDYGRYVDDDNDDRYLDSLDDRIDSLDDSRRIRYPRGQMYNDDGESRRNYGRQGIVRRSPVMDASYTRNRDSRRSGRDRYPSSSQRRSAGHVEFGGRSRSYPDSQQRDNYGMERQNGNFLDRRRSDLDSTRNYDYNRSDQRYRNDFGSRYSDGYERRGGKFWPDLLGLGSDRYSRGPRESKPMLDDVTSLSLWSAFVFIVLLPILFK